MAWAVARIMRRMAVGREGVRPVSGAGLPAAQASMTSSENRPVPLRSPTLCEVVRFAHVSWQAVDRKRVNAGCRRQPRRHEPAEGATTVAIERLDV